MRTLLVAFGLSFLLGILLTRKVRDLATRRGLVDVGGDRHIHTRPIPRLGGLALVISFALPLALLVAVYENDLTRAILQQRALVAALTGGGAVIVAVGLWDDLKGMRAWIKLAGQVAAALVVWGVGVRIEFISIPFVGPIHFGWFAVVVTVLWFVLVTNALNLIDGMDGLAGGVAILAGSALLVMSLATRDTPETAPVALILAGLLGAAAAFLVFNVNPASVILGDTGSLFLGFVLALVAAHSSQKSYAVFSLMAAFLALGLPLFDLAMAVVRRTLTGKRIFSPDQLHVHHLLLRRGLSQRRSVAFLYGVSAAMGGIALVFVSASDVLSAVTLVVTAAALFAAVRYLGYDRIIRAGRRDRALGTFEEAAAARSALVLSLRDRIRTAAGEEAAWNLLREAAPDLGWERIAWNGGPDAPERVWQGEALTRNPGVHFQDLQCTQVPIQGPKGSGAGWFQACWYRQEKVFGPHQELLVSVVAEALAGTRAGPPSDGSMPAKHGS
ncbi:MAG: undecaprenyl/decaprenyl-phosphate alpha-N-acetylglucosaminyl 1-phosphate transferase [Deltaproteobacteria bacterium]|nr:undecaprenyl/decaprenyl-phosphate alpha-N-acetylglucosaminyl 1-phosphate transferase [Deltaproteobacteria bacterium]